MGKSVFLKIVGNSFMPIEKFLPLVKICRIHLVNDMFETM